jgi:general secretion pathway protein I
MRQYGFTLVEVLVAVVIIAGGAIALTQTQGSSARDLAWLGQKTRAYQVAADKLVELQVYQQWPGTGTQDSRVERFGERWAIRTEISSGPFPDTRRVDIAVSPMEADSEAPAYVLASLIGKPGGN